MEAFEDPLSKIPTAVGRKWDKCAPINNTRNDGDTLCGLGPFKPHCIQRFATKKCFIAIFSILGVIQGMSWSYFAATISTLEKRLKISSQTAGIVMTGNEISQTIFAIILSYYGGNGHRPRWISAGVALSSISCILLASPHFIYGPGDEALSLTEEFYSSFHNFNNHSHLQHAHNVSEVYNFSTGDGFPHYNTNKSDFSKKVQLCEIDSEWTEKNLDCGAGEKSILSLALIFMSQFVSGIGGVLLVTLGGPYIDDNIEQVQMPKMLGITMSLRLVGPLLGYTLASICLKTYISPTLTPIIRNEDPRWMGAWWAGWVVLGIFMGIISFFIAMFPRQLKRKTQSNRKNSYAFKGQDDANTHNNTKDNQVEPYAGTILDLWKGVKSLSENKINMYNNLATVCYLFGVMGFATYINKYMETIYKVSSSEASGIPGVITIGGQAIGLVLSGFLISKYQPSARKLAGLNVITGFTFIVTLVVLTQIVCHQGSISFGEENTQDRTWNLTKNCNADCNCNAGQMLPVCYKEEKKIYYSACHAGCTTIENSTRISNCSCLPSLEDSVELGTCADNCFPQFMAFLSIAAFVRVIDSFGRIGNVLISYRCVPPKQKALAIGIAVFLMNLFGMLPSPILFGAIIDSVCLVWGTKCGARGNCLMYDAEKLVYAFNLTAAAFSFLGVLFDCLVCYYVKDLDLYDETNNTHKGGEPKSKREKI